MKKTISVILFGVFLFGVLSLSFYGCESTSSPTARGRLQPTELLYARATAHNNFVTTPIDQNAIDLIVRAGFTAPTGGNQRSIELFVVTERDVMRQIQEGHPYSSALDTTPLVIVVAANESLARFPELHEMDASLFAMTMIVQATDMGLSTCILSIAPQDERINAAKNALRMPANYRPILMVAFGHPGPDARTGASATVAHNVSQVHVNRYSQ